MGEFPRLFANPKNAGTAPALAEFEGPSLSASMTASPRAAYEQATYLCIAITQLHSVPVLDTVSQQGPVIRSKWRGW